MGKGNVYQWKKNTDGDNGGGDDGNESGKRSDSHQPSFTIGRH